jgi:flagellar basal body-associated protein FliL
VTRADHVPAEEIATHEGRQQLADEINLRANPPAAAEVAPAEA